MNFKETLKGIGLLRDSWMQVRRWQLRREYRERRHRYDVALEAQGSFYNRQQSISRIKAHIKSRGYGVTRRTVGTIHTYAIVPLMSWHRDLLPDLEELGPLSVFDYTSYGFSRREFLNGTDRARFRRAEMNSLLLEQFRVSHRRRPVDWVFCYGSGLEISAGTIAAIQEEEGVPCVGMSLDDKHTWNGPQMGDHRAGQVDIGPVFDGMWTSARIACEWYWAEGGRPVYMPEGFNVRSYHPMDVAAKFDVSFVGDAYGFRPSLIERIKGEGIEVHTFGHGWSEGSWVQHPCDVFNRTRINLGTGGIGYWEKLTNVKGRDFEVPASGGGVYLTTYSADLANHFTIGSEILCYQSFDELTELIRWYIRRPEEARAIAERGLRRCLREHRWIHRYIEWCRILDILEEDVQLKSGADS